MPKPPRRPAQHSSYARTRGSAKPTVSDAEREQIRARHARGESCNAIAEALGRSPSTITRQSRRLGLSFDRAATAAAVAAHMLDAKARRANLALNFLSDAERLREQMWVSYEDFAPVGGQEPTVLRWTRDEPSFADKERAARASGLMADKHMKLAEFDSDDSGASAVDKWLRGMLGEMH